MDIGGARRNRTDDLFNAIVKDFHFQLLLLAPALPTPFNIKHFQSTRVIYKFPIAALRWRLRLDFCHDQSNQAISRKPQAAN